MALYFSSETLDSRQEDIMLEMELERRRETEQAKKEAFIEAGGMEEEW